AGVPRFGADMDENNLPMECIESRAVSFSKGCYIGQEILNRIHAKGRVARELRGLRLPDDLGMLPKKGEKLARDGQEAGYITSAVKSTALGANIALGYVRREANQAGTELTLQTPGGSVPVRVVDLPFIAK
ncbi:MAG: glycine cleavage T C-terminal barrel domain-containing protein, partial [Limisphaerales bacterium]